MKSGRDSNGTTMFNVATINKIARTEIFKQSERDSNEYARRKNTTAFARLKNGKICIIFKFRVLTV